MRGVLLAERFRIDEWLGAGGMGQVWSAQDVRMRRNVAVKVVHPQYGTVEADAETRARFEREVQLAGRLSHPNIVTVHDWGEVLVDERRTLFLVMELVDGESVDRRLKRCLPPWPEAVCWAAQTADALHAAHREGVVHRDVKPANVLITPEGDVKVVDFGVAKFMGETLGARRLTTTGSRIGTLSYMSPEQAEGHRDINHSSDLYSLGCLLYDAVTGRPPFVDARNRDWVVAQSHTEETPEAPSVHAKDIPAELDDLILHLLAKKPEDRPADAADVHETLCGILVDHALTPDGEYFLADTRLGHAHSITRRVVTRTRRAWQATAWQDQPDVVLEAARAEADKRRSEAADQADALLARAAAEIRDRHEQARRETAETMRSAGERCDALVTAAEEQLEKAKLKAKNMVSEANSEAVRIRIAAVKKAEGLMQEAGQKRATLIQEAEELRAEALRYSKNTAEESRRELEILARRREDIGAEATRVQDVLEALESFKIPSATAATSESTEARTEVTEEIPEYPHPHLHPRKKPGRHRAD
ncbi:serine/threonine-protein kinase [Streptomyces geranii]|uniref:serine/threonine-protein kinase n=1 Tax=Streptomyces geranii TaxID=2058923 RepID=UPI000DD82C42|nr:serine/threonine protein kinase [Streptomyces geranii]